MGASVSKKKKKANKPAAASGVGGGGGRSKAQSKSTGAGGQLYISLIESTLPKKTKCSDKTCDAFQTY